MVLKEIENGYMRAMDFVVKLANDPRTEEPSIRKRNIDAIVNQINMFSQNPFFPQFLDAIDPSRFYSRTKCLSDCARAILQEAVDTYVRRN